MQHRPTSPSWQRDANGTWWRAATEHDRLAVPMDAADGYGVVLAGSPEEADRIDDEAFGPTIGAKPKFGAVVALVLLSIVFVGALDDVPHSRAAVVETAR